MMVPQTTGILNKVLEFMALDDQPFSVVVDIHWIPLHAPEKGYFSEVCVPEMYESVASQMLWFPFILKLKYWQVFPGPVVYLDKCFMWGCISPYTVKIDVFGIK